MEPRPSTAGPASVHPGLWLALSGWIGAVLVAVRAGAYRDMGDPPLPLLVSVAGPVLAAVGLFAASGRVRATMLSIDRRVVLGAQLWRVVGAAFLFSAAAGQLPAGFAQPAGWGDIATGVAALPILLALTSGTLTRARLRAFTALGMGDFAVAIVAGLALRPPALDRWPLILFPTVAVPLFAALHLLALAQARAATRPGPDPAWVKLTKPDRGATAVG